jgi:hypothetical protein
MRNGEVMRVGRLGRLGGLIIVVEDSNCHSKRALLFVDYLNSIHIFRSTNFAGSHCLGDVEGLLDDQSYRGHFLDCHEREPRKSQ